MFDNLDVEDADDLEQIWPASTNASVIITTRSPQVALGRATNLVPLECFRDTTGVKVLCLLSGRQPTDDADVAAAAETTQLLEGLPLAMVQVSVFIPDRNLLVRRVFDPLQQTPIMDARGLLIRCSSFPLCLGRTARWFWLANLLRDIVDMGAEAPEMRAHNAQALWFRRGGGATGSWPGKNT